MNALVEYIEVQIKCAKDHRAAAKQEADKDTVGAYYHGIVIGLDSGIDAMESILRVVKDFERLGLLK